MCVCVCVCVCVCGGGGGGGCRAFVHAEYHFRQNQRGCDGGVLLDTVCVVLTPGAALRQVLLRNARARLAAVRGSDEAVHATPAPPLQAGLVGRMLGDPNLDTYNKVPVCYMHRSSWSNCISSTMVVRPISRAEYRRKVPVSAFNVSPEAVAELHECDSTTHRTWRQHACCCTLDGGCSSCMPLVVLRPPLPPPCQLCATPSVRQTNSFSNHTPLSSRRLTDHTGTVFTTQSGLLPGRDCASCIWDWLLIGVHWLFWAGSNGFFSRLG